MLLSLENHLVSKEEFALDSIANKRRQVQRAINVRENFLTKCCNQNSSREPLIIQMVKQTINRVITLEKQWCCYSSGFSNDEFQNRFNLLENLLIVVAKNPITLEISLCIIF